MPIIPPQASSSNVLPLSAFQATSFSPTSLLVHTESLSHSEMLKMMTEYEQSIRSELVALVNENCREFLEVSSVMTDLTKKLVSLKDPLVLKYKSSASFADFTRQLSTTIRNSDKLKAELVELEQSKFDMHTISDVVASLIDADQILTDGGELDPDSLSVISREMSRCYAMLSALDSVIAETGVSSSLLRELVPKLRAEHSRIRSTRLAPRIETELVVCLSKLSDTSNDNLTATLESVTLLSDLLGSRDKFYDLLRHNVLGDSIRWKPHQEPFCAYLERLRATWLVPSSILSKLASRDAEIFLQVLFRSFTEELLTRTDRSTQVTLFVPTSTTLDLWYQNYTESEKFLSLVGSMNVKFILEFQAKWKIQIYVSMCMKQLSQQILTSPVSERPRVLLEQAAMYVPRLVSLNQSVMPRLMELLIELFDSLVKNLIDQDKVTLFFYYQDLAAVVPELISCFPAPIHTMLYNEQKIFKKKADEILLATVSEISSPMSQTYDSVKQVSALYRVASNRGLPTRHSVYVDLAVKPLQNFRDSFHSGDTNRIAQFKQIVEAIVTRNVLKSYMQSVTELMAKERGRGGKDELGKISCQILLDLKRTKELMFSPTREFEQFIEQFGML